MDGGKSEETSYPPCHRPPALSFFLSPASLRHKQGSSEERGFVPKVWQCASFSSFKVVAVRVARQTRWRGWTVTFKMGWAIKENKGSIFWLRDCPFLVQGG